MSELTVMVSGGRLRLSGALLIPKELRQGSAGRLLGTGIGRLGNEGGRWAAGRFGFLVRFQLLLFLRVMEGPGGLVK